MEIFPCVISYHKALRTLVRAKTGNFYRQNIRCLFVIIDNRIKLVFLREKDNANNEGRR